MEKSQFLRLAYQVHSGGAVTLNRQAKAAVEVQHLWEELEASQKVQVELREGSVNTIGGLDMTQE